MSRVDGDDFRDRTLTSLVFWNRKPPVAPQQSFQGESAPKTLKLYLQDTGKEKKQDRSRGVNSAAEELAHDMQDEWQQDQRAIQRALQSTKRATRMNPMPDTEGLNWLHRISTAKEVWVQDFL